MTHIFETERLILREFTPGDKKFIVELLNSDGWSEFIGVTKIKTEEQAEEYLERLMFTSYRNNGYGLSMVELKETMQPIGMCGILKRPDLEKPDIGFAFLPEFMRKGYAYEIAGATMTHAKDILMLDEVFAITVSHNIRSIKLLEKIGMKFSKMIKMNEEELMLFSNSKTI
ncbi:MAG: acetyltransferase [Bacteroidota bacterium]|nr:acetyltransferase [Bacteroidota bacterium]